MSDVSLLALAIPKEYGQVNTAQPLRTIELTRTLSYVVGVTAFTCFLGLWQGARVSSFRKPAKIVYPQAYAESSDIANAETPALKKNMYLFNCAQRAHQNFNENHPSVIASLLLSGLVYPHTAAALGAIWSLGRIVYAIGYTDPNKEKGAGRVYGFGLGFLSQLILFGLTAYTGVKMVL